MAKAFSASRLPQIVSHISPSIERCWQMVMFQFLPEPYRPFIIQTGIADKYIIFFVLLHIILYFINQSILIEIYFSIY